MDNEEEPEPTNYSALSAATAKCLLQIKTQAKSCRGAVADLTKKLKSGELSTDKGLSFLEMKNHTVLSYLISLSGLIQEKIQGHSIQGSPFIDQLVETRTVLEKIRPTDIKLKYKVDKLIRTAVEGKTESDPLRFRANLDNLSTDRTAEQEENESSESEIDIQDPEMKTRRKGEKISSDGIYRPPRVAPQHFDEKTGAGGRNEADEKFKKRAFSGTIIRELQEEFLDTPVEIHNMGDAYAKQLSRETKEKQRYEETYMTRLPMTKADRHKERSMSTLGVLGDELTDFSGKGKSGAQGKKRKSFSGGGKGKSRGRGSKKKFRK